MENKEEKFKTIVDQNKEKIIGICRYYAPSIDDRDDMYQEILMNIWKSLDSFRGDAKIETWIYRIAVNTSLNFAGKRYKQMKLNVDIESPSVRKNLIDETENETIGEDRLQYLQILLNQLNVIDKAVMGLVFDDLSNKDIADIIGITEPNVRIKIHRIKKQLYTQLKGKQNE